MSWCSTVPEKCDQSELGSEALPAHLPPMICEPVDCIKVNDMVSSRMNVLNEPVWRRVSESISAH